MELTHITNNKYLVGAYERLSREDNKLEESSSIKSQRMIIESFAKFNHLSIIKHYSDDGFTGSNFERPGFEELKKDIEDGFINCVIVKDLSRLGRDLYLTGDYIENYFLERQVRFIAINDGYDSMIEDSLLGIRLSLNDMYLRDFSKKIRSSFDIKRKNGDYIGTYPKYGYLKDPKNSKHLIPDPVTFPIVKQMFDWAANGDGTTVIANRLTEMKIPVPSIYKRETNRKANHLLHQDTGIWRTQTVRDILRSQMYLGHMVQGQYKKLSYNSKALRKTKESDWIIVENTHEAIIDQETFDIVQNYLNKNKNKFKTTNKEKYLFQGLIKCKKCGSTMSIYKTTSNHHFLQCNSYSKYGKYDLCSSHSLSYDRLERDLLFFLKEIGQRFLENYDESRLLDKTKKIQPTILLELTKKQKDLSKKISTQNQLIEELYEQRLLDEITLNQFKVKSKNIKDYIKTLQAELEPIEKEIALLRDNEMKLPLQVLSSLMKEFMSLQKPTQQLISQLIDKILIDKERNIEIYFKVNMTDYIQLEKKKGDLLNA